MLAGAENVVAPLWPVEDSIARIFITEFYEALLGTPAAEALRNARCAAAFGHALMYLFRLSRSAASVVWQ